MKRYFAVLALLAMPAFAQTPTQQRIDAAALAEAVSELHNAQNQIIASQAQLKVQGEDLTAAQVKAKHADDLDAWVKAYFASAAPTP